MDDYEILRIAAKEVKFWTETVGVEPPLTHDQGKLYHVAKLLLKRPSALPEAALIHPDNYAATVDILEQTRRECEVLRMQIGYIVTQLQIAGDKRSLPEIVEEAERACRPQSGSE